MNPLLVGGFNPFEKYLSNWKSSPNSGENRKYLKPPPRLIWLLEIHGASLWTHKIDPI